MLISHLSRRLAGLVSNYQVLCHTSLPHLVCLEQIINTSFSALSSSSCNSTKLYSTTVAEVEETRTFVASYLTNSCGLSSERAAFISSTSLLKFCDAEKPNAVLNLLRDVGFKDTQITKIINEAPRLLSYANPEKQLLPKIQFLYDAGFDKKDLCQLVYKNPGLMLRSLKHHIIPLYKFIHNVLGTHDKVVLALRRGCWTLGLADLNKCLAPNIVVLQEIGMPPSLISSFMTYKPRTLTRKHSEFKEAVEEALKWGLKPNKSTFINAVDVCINKGTMDRNIEILKEWGWSDDDIISALRKHPQFMLISEYKMCRMLEFLEKIGYDKKSIMRFPLCMCYNLESRIIPRFSVMKVLLSMGLIEKLKTLASVLVPPEERFLDMYVTRFGRKAPQLMIVYRGKIDPFKDFNDRK